MSEGAVSTQPKQFYTEEEYLEIDRKAEFKSEYFRGEMFAMSGARRAHNLVDLNLYAELRNQLRSGTCEAYPSEMRVRVNSTGLYAYPDATIVCGKPEFVDGEFDTLLNPAVVVEVLSPSTEAYDRGEKFEFYRSIESVQEYLLVATDHPHTDLFTRQADGSWLFRSASRDGDIVELTSVGCRLKLGDLYEKVEFVIEPRGRMRPVNRT